MLYLKPKKSKKYKYCIFRILGNETPPRDEPDARLKTLQFILENEPEFTDTIKCYIINCIHDKERREYICNMLAEHNLHYVVVPIFRDRYQKATTRLEKITEAVGINRARNLAVRHGRLFSDFIFVLDGDCFFTKDLWETVTNQITEDQEIFPDRKYYSTPSSRATFEHVLTSNDPMLLAEPMVIFRHDAGLFFDERLPFGQGDKLKFLYQLGHSQEHGKHHLVTGDLCRSVGMVHHLTGSSYEIELDQKLRNQLRNESLDRLIWQIDNPEEAFPGYAARKHNKPNEYWKKIQGWFDFRGQYSHFAWSQPSGCRFVEIGSWLGASICYLATEFKNRNKTAEIYSIDTWEGSNEAAHVKLIKELGGSNALYNRFLKNIRDAEVSDIVKPIKEASITASQRFSDESLDVVFIDASHEFQDVLADIQAWLPKVKVGGVISGHDYAVGHKVSESGVIKAVNQMFVGKHLEIGQAGRTWLHIKK